MYSEGGASGEEPAASASEARAMGSIPGSERSPGEGNGNAPQYSCLGESHAQRSMAGYSHGLTEPGAAEAP